ncbi:hypothetical protein DITRI_Ditri09bG0065100 [Diplodiscus trichospermus]
MQCSAISFSGQKIKNNVFHSHPLTLEDDPETIFVCDGCQELCYGLSYRSILCKFSLDIRCAALNEELAKHEVQKAREIKATINHFSHSHQLTRCKIGKTILQRGWDLLPCIACQKDLCGLIYTCCLCEHFFLHESCLTDMQTQVQSLFHPQHPLHLIQFPLGVKEEGDTLCHACSSNVKGILISCFECQTRMHRSCAMYQTRKIKHDCHDHRLLHLGKSIFVKSSPECSACYTDCSDTLCCCKGCNFYIHLECMPLPYRVKHRRHLHPLTLTYFVVEDDLEEYYCDMCETKRNPEHDVYYCEECTYIAHIDCVISEVEPPEKIFEYLDPDTSRNKKAGKSRRKSTMHIDEYDEMQGIQILLKDLEQVKKEKKKEKVKYSEEDEDAESSITSEEEEEEEEFKNNE